MPGEKSKTIEEQISELEAKKARYLTKGGAHRQKSLEIDLLIQELRDTEKRKN